MDIKALKKFNLKNGKNITKRLAKHEDGLKGRIIKGGFWVFFLQIINKIFQLAKIIILARLLSPNDFGLFGITLLSLSALDAFSRTGFRQALIQKKENIKSYLNTAWTIDIIRALLIVLILFFIAPCVAKFFEAPVAEPILKVIGLAIVLQSLTNIAVVYFEKELKFYKYFAYQFIGTIVDVVVAITVAFLFHSVWALVFGLLAGNLVRCIISYIIDPYRPKFQFNLDKAKELFGFGKWILGSSILVFFIIHGDDIFVGKLLGITMLGFYQMAYRISNMPATEISYVISLVTFPVYSKLQDNILKLREVYLKILSIVVFLSFPVASLIFILASDFTQIFLGEKWMPMVPAMMVLCLFGITRVINSTINSIFLGIGKPNIMTVGSGIQLILMAIIIYPLTNKWGILGTAIAVVIPNIIIMLYLGKRLMNALNYKLVHLIMLLYPPMIGSVVMCVVIFFLKFKIWTTVSLISFLFFIFFGICIYFAIIYKINNNFYYGLKEILKKTKREIIK